MPDKNDKLGALWVKSGPKGEYFTGQIGEQKIVVFQNGFKTEEKHPDWIIFKSRPRETP
jgi:hypothetical protein